MYGWFVLLGLIIGRIRGDGGVDDHAPLDPPPPPAAASPDTVFCCCSCRPGVVSPEPIGPVTAPPVLRGEMHGLLGAVFAFRDVDALLRFGKMDDSSVPIRGVSLGSNSNSPGSVRARSRLDDTSIREVELSIVWLGRSAGNSVGDAAVVLIAVVVVVVVIVVVVVVVVVAVVVSNSVPVTFVDSGLPSITLLMLL